MNRTTASFTLTILPKQMSLQSGNSMRVSSLVSRKCTHYSIPMPRCSNMHGIISYPVAPTLSSRALSILWLVWLSIMISKICLFEPDFSVYEPQIWHCFRWTSAQLATHDGCGQLWVYRLLSWSSHFHPMFRWTHIFRSFPIWSITSMTWSEFYNPLLCVLADLFYSDLFSFYKEESSHENTNHVSLLAQLTGKSKLQCMKDLAAHSLDGR